MIAHETMLYGIGVAWLVIDLRVGVDKTISLGLMPRFVVTMVEEKSAIVGWLRREGPFLSHPPWSLRRPRGWRPWHDGPVNDGGPAEWIMRHQEVRLRPVEERDLELLERAWTDPALSEPFEWHGYRDPTVHRHRWEQDRYLGQQDSMLVVAPPDQDLAFGGFVVWRAVRLSGPVVCYNIGILLLPDHRGHGLGAAAQCLLADHLFSTTLANRVEAGTEAENIAEQRALEKAGFQREGLHRGRGYRQGRMVDGLSYARLRSDPHP